MSSGGPGAALRILLVTPYVPHRDVGHGTSTIVSRFVQYFGSRHDLSVLTFWFKAEELDYVSSLKSACSLVQAVPFPRSWMHRQAARAKSLERGLPLMVPLFNVVRMREEIAKLLSRQQPELVQIDTTQMGQYVDLLENRGVKRVLLEIDVSMKPLWRRFQLTRSPWKRLWYRREWRSMCRYEPRMCRKFDLVYALTEEDRQLLKRSDPGLPVSLFRVGADSPLFEIPSREGSGNTIVFIGSFMHPPNVDGALWFYRDIFPRIRQRVPGVKLYLVGGGAPPELEKLANDHDVVLPGGAPGPDGRSTPGSRAHVGAYLAMADVCVVPLRLGGGVKMKTVEMMAAGRAIVITSVGREGLALRDGQHALVSDTPQEFASKVVSLLRDGRLRASLGREARSLALREHLWERNLRAVEDELETLVFGAGKPKPRSPSGVPVELSLP